MNGEPIAGNSGAIINLTVKAQEGLNECNLTGYFRNVKLSKADGTGNKITELAFPVMIVAPSVISAKSYTRYYGDANPVFDYDVSGGDLDGVPELTCAATTTSPVGTYDIIVSQGSVSNYNVTYVKGTLTIEATPLTIRAGTYTKKQGDPMPDFNLQYDGFKNNESEAVLTKMPEVTCNATVSSAPGEYPVIVSGAEAQNYDISYVNGILIVIELQTYTLLYIVDDMEYSRYTLHEGDSITPEYEPVKEGFTFSGWSEIPATMPDHDVTITGSFSINSYTLTYMIGQEVYKQMIYEYMAAITPEPQPEGDYNSFKWVGVPETIPAHDVTVKAVYETGIAELVMMAQLGKVRIYAPSGKQLQQLQKGLNIIVMQDGTTRKVVIK